MRLAYRLKAARVSGPAIPSMGPLWLNCVFIQPGRSRQAQRRLAHRSYADRVPVPAIPSMAPV